MPCRPAPLNGEAAERSEAPSVSLWLTAPLLGRGLASIFLRSRTVSQVRTVQIIYIPEPTERILSPFERRVNPHEADD